MFVMAGVWKPSHELTFCTLRPASEAGVLPKRSF
jgi:hypothetical protein